VSLLLTILAFGVMIFIHELGHFKAARFFGVEVEKFSIGFGRPLVQFVKNGVQWSIGWIPLGGYVRMKGEDPESLDVDSGGSFQGLKWWKRAIIACSGPFANLLFGILMFVIAFALPLRTQDHRPVVFRAEGKWESVFVPGDSIKAVNGKPVQGWWEFLGELSQSTANRVDIVRNAAQLTLPIAPADTDSLLRSLSPMLSTAVGDVYTGLPAWRAGLKKGDIILSVDSVAVSDWYAMRERIVGSPRRHVRLGFRRGNEILSRDIVLEQNDAIGEQRMIGIGNYQPVEQIRRSNIIDAVRYGVPATFDYIGNHYSVLFKMFLKPSQLARNVGGPVMIATMSNEIGSRGIGYLIMFFGSISLILMIMNLLPIPILDGGHVMFCLIEGITGRPVSLRVQSILQRIGFSLLIMLMLLAFYSDITKVLARVFSG
jgi:regulator of sigma E protease